MQEEIDVQAESWSCVWGSNKTCTADPQWPADMGEIPPLLLEDSLVQAGLSFARGLGLGWDGIHPRMLARISPFLLRWIACVMLISERSGSWDPAVA